MLTSFAPEPGAGPVVGIEEGVQVHRLFPLHPFSSIERPAMGDQMAELSLELWNPWMERTLEKVIAAFAPDLIHAHYIPRISFGAFARAGNGRPRVLTFHSYHYECPKGGLFRKRGVICTAKPLPCQGFEKMMMRWLGRVERVIAISRFIEGGLIEAGMPRDRVVWLPNGVPLTTTDAPAPSSSRRVLFVGRLEPNKGADVLLRAFRGLENPAARLRIVGSGSQMDRLRGLAAAEPRIEFSGWLKREELSDAYRSSRFVVLPSVYHEGLNTVLCEAAALGRPVIATRLGGNSDLVDEDVSGYLCPAGDAEALRERMATLLEDDALADSFGAAGRRHIQAFALERHLDSVERLYAELLGVPSAAMESRSQ